MIRFLLALFIALSLTAQSLAQTADAPTDPEPVISIDDNSRTDKAIKRRIDGIFEELGGLENVSVTVSEGVVTLSGTTSSEAQADTAERIAIRLEGVVTVKDEIERTLDVEGNVTPALDKLKADFRNFIKAGPLMGVALIIWLAFSLLGWILSRLKGLWNRLTPNSFLAGILSQAVRWSLFAIGAFIAFDLLGATKYLTPLLGGLGVVSIAVGFAVRDTLENYLSSIMLSLRQPFRAKDRVKINDHEGIVIRLTSRATILMTLDGNHLRIPNSTVFKAIILNYSRNPERRFDFTIGVDSSDDPIAAIHEGVDAIKDHSFVLADPSPAGGIVEVGDSNIVLRFSAWVNQDETSFGKARSLAIRAVTSHLQDKGFSLPEPIYRLRMDNLSSLNVDTTPQTPVQPTSPTQAEPDHTLDTRPETHLEDQIDEELSDDKHPDLLDDNTPTE